MSRLTVLNVAFPLTPLGQVGSAGAAEQLIVALDRALCERGHRSVVVACEGSLVRGELIATPRSPALLDERARRDAHEALRAAIARARRGLAVDLVHLHGVDFNDYLPAAGPPALVTLHLPPSCYPVGALRCERPGTFLHGVSPAQHRACPPGTVLLDPIPYGVAVDELLPAPSSGRYALVLGRISPERGIHLAIEAAREADVPLVLAGEVRSAEQERYFEEEVRPRLDRRRRFVGAVGVTRRRRLLAGARCLLVTSLVPEDGSSLVGMEALACGTPVIASAVEDLVEVVEHGETGLLVAPGDVGAAARALREVDGLSRARCRDAAVRRFSLARAVDEYLRRYHELVDVDRRVASMVASGPRRRVAGAPPRVGVEVMTDLAALEASQAEWLQLWRRCPRARVFQRPEWLLAWHRHLGPTSVRALAVRRDDELVGLIPLTSFRRQGERALGLGGGGVSDVLDALVDPAHEVAVGEALARHLSRSAEPWDVLDLERLPAASPLLRLPLAPAEDEVSVQDVCPVLRLPLCPGDLPDVVSRRLLSTLEEAWRRLERTARVTISRPGEADLPATVEALLHLHRTHLPPRAALRGLADPAVQRFHAEAAAALGAAGLLRLHVLRADDRLLGGLLALRERQRLTCYMLVTDPALDGHHAADLLVKAAVDDAIRAGVTEVDFLGGREPWKYRWGGRDEPVYRRVLRRRPDLRTAA